MDITAEIWPRIAVFLCGIGTLYLLIWVFSYNRYTVPRPRNRFLYCGQCFSYIGDRDDLHYCPMCGVKIC